MTQNDRLMKDNLPEHQNIGLGEHQELRHKYNDFVIWSIWSLHFGTPDLVISVSELPTEFSRTLMQASADPERRFSRQIIPRVTKGLWHVTTLGEALMQQHATARPWYLLQ